MLAIHHHMRRRIERLVFLIRVAYLKVRGREIVLGNQIQLFGVPRLQLQPNSSLLIGSGSIIRSLSNSNPIGIDQPVTFCTLRPGAKIIIGDRAGISGGSLCAMESIEIGEGSLVGANSYIFDNDFHPVNPELRTANDEESIKHAPVKIGCNVFIGTRSIILKGVSIGDNSVVGAGSVVTNSIPANVIAAGNPCRVVRKNIVSL